MHSKKKTNKKGEERKRQKVIVEACLLSCPDFFFSARGLSSNRKISMCRGHIHKHLHVYIFYRFAYMYSMLQSTCVHIDPRPPVWISLLLWSMYTAVLMFFLSF